MQPLRIVDDTECESSFTAFDCHCHSSSWFCCDTSVVCCRSDRISAKFMVIRVCLMKFGISLLSELAGGHRANTIHYTANNQILAAGQLVLMDAGCECHGYTSDITRTWPVSGRRNFLC